MEKDDWRLRGQEEYMKNIKFQYVKFTSQESLSLHTQCEFCWHKFMENPEGVKDCSGYGYRSLNRRYWVCEKCFEDFKKMFCWSIKG